MTKDLENKINEIVTSVWFHNAETNYFDVVEVNTKRLLSLFQSEMVNIFSRLPSKDDPMSRKEMVDKIEEEREKIKKL